MMVFTQIFVLFLMMLVGYVIRKKEIISENGIQELSRLVLYVTLPALIIKVMQYDFTPELLREGIKMPLISLSIYGFYILLSFGLVRILKVYGPTRDVFQVSVIFPNVAFMGYPVLISLYGQESLFYGALFNMPFDLLLWTLGVYMLNRHGSKDKENTNPLKVLLNPGTVSVTLGFTMFLLRIKLPPIIMMTLDYVSACTVPLAMIVVGAILTRTKIAHIFTNKKLIALSLIKMVAIPLVLIGVLRLLGFEGYFLNIPVLLMSMPAASNVAIFAARYESDAVTASQSVFLTTILSLVTIPLIASLL